MISYSIKTVIDKISLNINENNFKKFSHLILYSYVIYIFKKDNWNNLYNF